MGLRARLPMARARADWRYKFNPDFIMRRPSEQQRGNRRERTKSDMDQKVLDIRRTARVVAGGRRFSFRAAVVIGDRNGRVGLGMGKAPSVAEAVDKGAFQARKRLIVVPLTAAKSIPYAVQAKFSASRVLLKPGREGRGVIAGGPVRVISDLAGIRNLTAKILGRTPNKLNNAQATMEALKKLKPEAGRRNQGKKANEEKQAQTSVQNS